LILHKKIPEAKNYSEAWQNILNTVQEVNCLKHALDFEWVKQIQKPITINESDE